MLQNKNKSRSRSSQYQQTISSPKEILYELLKIDDQQIFLKELDQMKGMVKMLNTKENQTIAMSEFLKQKLEEVQLQISIAKSSLKSDFASLIDLKKLEETRKCITYEIKLISNEKKHKFSKIELFQNELEEGENNFFNQKLYDKIVLKLNVIYHDGSDLQPQIVNLLISPEISFREFLKKLKESLEIYEFSRFKLVLMNEKKEEKFVTNMSDFNYYVENFVKIVPKHYKLNVNC